MTSGTQSTSDKATTPPAHAQTPPPRHAPRTTLHLALWVLQLLLAASFLYAGYLKLAGDPTMIALFDAIGWGQWFRLLTGTLEILGALTQLVPRLRALGALGLIGVMIGALITSFAVGISPGPASAELLIAAVIAWGRRHELTPSRIVRRGHR